MLENLHLKSVKCQGLKEFDNTPKRCKTEPMRTGELIKKARETMGLTQEEVAKLARISQKSWSKIEKGIIKRPRNLSLIESILGLPVGYLTNQKSNVLQFPQPLMARCPLLDWEIATKWPQEKETISEKVEIKSFASQVIISANGYVLRVENDPISNGGYFKEGSYLLVDPDEKIESGDFVIVKLQDSTKAFCRRYAKEGNLEYLFANISGIEPIKINNDVTILGAVLLDLNIHKEKGK